MVYQPYQPQPGPQQPQQSGPQYHQPGGPSDLSEASGASAFFSAWLAPLSLFFPTARRWWKFWWAEGKGKIAAAIFVGLYILNIVLSAVVAAGLPDEAEGASGVLGNAVVFFAWIGVAAWLMQSRPRAAYGPAQPQPGYPQPGYPQPGYPHPYPQPGYPQPGYQQPPTGPGPWTQM